MINSNKNNFFCWRNIRAKSTDGTFEKPDTSQITSHLAYAPAVCHSDPNTQLNISGAHMKKINEGINVS